MESLQMHEKKGDGQRTCGFYCSSTTCHFYISLLSLYCWNENRHRKASEHTISASSFPWSRSKLDDISSSKAACIVSHCCFFHNILFSHFCIFLPLLFFSQFVYLDVTCTSLLWTGFLTMVHYAWTKWPVISTRVAYEQGDNARAQMVINCHPISGSAWTGTSMAGLPGIWALCD